MNYPSLRAEDYGGWENDGASYILNTKLPPREWKNVHFSGTAAPIEYWSRFTNTGAGSVFCVDLEGNRCVLVGDEGRKTIWFRDDDSARVFSLAGFPVPTEVADYRCRFDLASTTISSRYSELALSWRAFVPRGEAFEVWTLELVNGGSAERRISIFPYAELRLEGFKSRYEFGSWHKAAHFDAALNAAIARNLYPNPRPELYSAMLASSLTAVGYSGGNDRFFAPSYSLSHPRLGDGSDLGREDHLHDETGDCLALQVKVRLKPGERIRVDFIFGVAGDRKNQERLSAFVKDAEAIDAAHESVAEEERRLASTSRIRTGDQRIDRHFNYWLKKEMHAYLAFKTGTRDNFQTVGAYCAVDYDLARSVFLSATASQYEDGSFPHSRRPLNEKRYSDKPGWFLLAAPALVAESGDFSLLEQQLPWLLPGGGSTARRDTVLEHLLRAREYLERDVGIHGLKLIGAADWNDDLDGPGADGQGESVMATELACAGYRACAELFDAWGKPELAASFRQSYERAASAILRHCRAEDRFIGAFDGNGRAIGAPTCPEGSIYANSQSWAVLSRIVEGAEARKLLENAESLLLTPYGVAVHAPPYTRYDPSVGSLSAALPGFYVNGVYNHAAAFVLVADCVAGRADAAWRAAMDLVPDGPTNPVGRSLCEPFALTNCWRSDSLRGGLCGDVWHTGTAAWLFTGLLEHIVGLRRDWDGLVLDPRLPEGMNEVRAERLFRACRYEVRVVRYPEKSERSPWTMTIDGVPAAGNRIPHIPGRKTCRVVAEIGAPADIQE